MESILTVENVSKVLTVSSGIFAGMNLGLSLGVVPAILKSKDPLPVIKEVYSRCSKIAIPCVLVSTTAGLSCFIRNGMRRGDIGFLVAGGLSACVIPWTSFMIMPINDHLFSMRPDEDTKVVKERVKRWGEFHWVRTLIGVTVFTLHVLKIGQVQPRLILK